MALLCLSLTAASVRAQNGWFSRYQARTAATLVNQPHWATPLVTTNARVEQGLRADFVRQPAATDTTWNLGNTKGLQVVPFARTELRISPPPFITHTAPGISDGFGDLAFRVKYRLYGSNEQHHNAIVSGLVSASLPTGKNTNGSCCAVISPSLELGKGFGKLALTTSAAAALPVTGAARLGRPITLNNAVQYHLTRFVWLQDEFNTTIYSGGKNDGHQQTFDTPGVVVSRLPVARASSLLLTVGAGEQIALTHFHTYNHSPILTLRLRF